MEPITNDAWVLSWRGRWIAVMTGTMATEHPADFAKEMRMWKRDTAKNREIIIEHIAMDDFKRMSIIDEAEHSEAYARKAKQLA